ncbi:MAG: ADP-ribosylation factor family-domain-containing protein [Piptocephalis tieghemiana]|nr:MAG: ADP-ribosylation factor family-domain-containing protein [Piptocephalis tieghemiana]
MFTLLSGLYSQWTQKEEYYIIILGLDNAGKTTLLERVKSIYMGVQGLPPDKITPTVGLNIGKVDIDKTRINFWDLGGQKDLRTLWPKYYNECHGIIFIVDACDPARLQECRETFEEIVGADEVEGVPVLMLANKQDLPQAQKVEDIKEVFNKIAERLDAQDSRALPVSALSGEGVRDAIDWLIPRVINNKESRPPIIKD